MDKASGKMKKSGKGRIQSMLVPGASVSIHHVKRV